MGALVSNFLFMEEKFPVLEKLGTLAESYLYSDPNACLYKMGALAETIVNYMFELDNIIPGKDDATQANRVKRLLREGLISKEINDIFYLIRIRRNEAVHAGYDSFNKCVTLLEMTYTLSVWFMQVYGDVEYKPIQFVLPDDISKQANYQKLIEENERLAADLEKMQAAVLSKLAHRHMHDSERRKHAEKASRNLRFSEKGLRYLTDELLRDKNGPSLRPYQIKAIEKAEAAVAEGKRTVLIAMASGTGKTRTMLGIIYRFLKTGRFRKILFLVDRIDPGEQTSDIFKELKIEGLTTLDEIYDVSNIDDAFTDGNIFRESKIHVATVQNLVKRIICNDTESMPPVTDYDLIIADESRNDYISKYHLAIEYFDAVKIVLTSNPASNTVEIFGDPVFEYSYQRAVDDGYLIKTPDDNSIEAIAAQLEAAANLIMSAAKKLRNLGGRT
jgi:hypothetical protein